MSTCANRTECSFTSLALAASQPCRVRILLTNILLTNTLMTLMVDKIISRESYLYTVNHVNLYLSLIISTLGIL